MTLFVICGYFTINMAVPLGESKRNIIEKISNIPAFDPLNAHGFNHMVLTPIVKKKGCAF